MKDYESASKELYEFEEALKKAKDASMEVEWFSAFIGTIMYTVATEKSVEFIVKDCISLANKKLGM